jgi:hypothetical protein
MWIEFWKAGPRLAERPENAQVAPWCDSLITQIRGGVGFSNDGDFVAALMQRRLRVYSTAGFGPDPVIDAKLTRISSEQALANGQGFTFGPLALHRTKDGSLRVAWANNGVRVLTAVPREPELDGSGAQVLAAPLAEPPAKLKFDDGANFLFRQDFDVSTRRLRAFVWDLRKDWTNYIDEHVTGRRSLSQLKDFVCEIASFGFDLSKTESEDGNDHVSYTDEEKRMLGWDESSPRPLTDPCAPDSHDAHDRLSAPPG